MSVITTDRAKLWMVLVGVDHYRDPQIRNLRYCANDCKELAAAFKLAAQNFQATEIIALYHGGEQTPELAAINTSIEKFRSAKPEDTVLFYFSGHGYLDSNHRPVLCVADTNLNELAETGLKLDTLLSELSQCQAARQLVWLDACQELEPQLDNHISTNFTDRLSAVLQQQADRSSDFYAILSCDRQERSWEFVELQHGLFTYYLIEGLRGKAANADKNIDIDSLFRYVERSCQKFIESKKSIGNRDDFSKGLDLKRRESSARSQINNFPPDATQNPKRIARGGSNLIIGMAAPPAQKKALIVDRLSSSVADISLCKILQAKSGFEVEYYFIPDKQQQDRDLQRSFAEYLHDESSQTLLFYLAGTIESSAGIVRLVCQDTSIDLNWLAQQIQDSPIKDTIVIADLFDSSGTTRDLRNIFKLQADKSLCLLTATTTVPNSKQFLDRLVSSLETAGESEAEFWTIELISQLRGWCETQPQIDLKYLLSGSTKVTEILSVKVQRSEVEVFEIDVCPYKSLEAFSQDDAYFFHGREDLIAEIIEKLRSTSFLAVIGASGSGKSSVVRAGVIPQLVTTGLFDAELGQNRSCQAWVMLPGDNPLAALATALAPDNPGLLEGVLDLGVDSLVAWLRQQPKSISVLVIDQFERLFSQTPEVDRLNFLSLILGTIAKAGDCFKVVITLRSDFLNECLGMSDLAPLIIKSEVLVSHCRLKNDQYSSIIAQPAQKVGLEVEDNLIDLLLEELKDGSLPLLQYALAALWNQPQRSRGKLTVHDYRQYICKLGSFLSNKADETYQNLSKPQQECAQSIFLYLVSPAKQKDTSIKDTIRRLRISELKIEKYRDVFDRTLQALIDARLLVVRGEENNLALGNKQQSDLAITTVDDELATNSRFKDKATVEIAHEILLQDWETLRWWVEQNREKYLFIDDISQAAEKWKQNGKQDGFLFSKGALAKYEEFYIKYADELLGDSNEFFGASIQARDKAEKLANRRQRQIIGGLTGGIVAISIFAGAALWQLRQATLNEIDALSSSSEALLASKQELDALVAGLKAGGKIKNSFGIDNDTKIKLVGGLQNIFMQVKEFNRLESDGQYLHEIILNPNGQIIASVGLHQNIKLWNLQGKLIHILQNTDNYYNDQIFNAVFSPDGKIIASAANDGKLKLWNLSGELINNLDSHDNFDNHTRSIEKVVFSPDGKIIASVSNFGEAIKLWNLQGKVLLILQGNNVAFSPDGQIIACNGSDGFKLWNLQGKLLYTFENRIDRFAKLVFSPDGKTIASISEDGFKFWNLQGKLLRTFENQDTFENYIGRFAKLVFSPDGRTIATVSEHKLSKYRYISKLKLWNSQGKLVHTLQGQDINNSASIHAVIFNPDGRTIASAMSNVEIKIWDLQGELISTLEGDGSSVQSIVFSLDGQVLASANNFGKVQLWNLQSKLIPNIKNFTDELFPSIKNTDMVAFNSNGQIIASARSDNKIRVWNIQGQLISSFGDSNTKIRALQFSPNSQIIASGHDDGYIKLWNIEGRLLLAIPGHKELINKLLFSPSGKYIASFGKNSHVKLWNLQGQLLYTAEGSNNYSPTLVFSPDSQTIAYTDKSDVIKIKYIQGQIIRVFRDYKKISRLLFSPNGQTLALQDIDGNVRLQNLQNKSIDAINCTKSSNSEFAFSPDGNFFAAQCEGTQVKLWDSQGKLLNTFDNQYKVRDIVFSLDGKNIAYVSSDDLKVKTWNLQQQLLHILDGRILSKVIFSQDGKNIIFASNDKTVKIWNLQGKLLQSLQLNNKHDEDVVLSYNDKNLMAVLGASVTGSDGNVKIWSLDLDEVMIRGCDWVRDYLANNPKVNEEDRKICDGIGSK